MGKSTIFIFIFSLLTQSCGQKSTIKNYVEAETLASKYGDGKQVIRNLTFPLSDSSLAYNTPLPGIGPIAGGILKFVGNIFAANTQMGKLQMSYTQTIPELPEELRSVRLKRFFFYMKPQGKQRRFRDWVDRIVFGKGHVTFDFLDKLAVKLESVKLEKPDQYIPTLQSKNYDKDEMRSLMSVFGKYYQPTVIDPEKAKELVLFKYSHNEREMDSALKNYGPIYILETPRARETKHFLMDHPKMRGYYKKILILQDSLLVELDKDPVAEETFKVVLSEIAEELDERFEVDFIDTCTPESCLDLNVPDVNLTPIAVKGNAIKLDAVIHAGKVPESFKLKGFVEFEIKVMTPRGV
jgi:hypothetical protein